MSYYMIYVRDGRTWSPQFGDKDVEVVQQEVEDTYLRERGRGYEGDGRYERKDIKTVRFPRVPSRAQIEVKTWELNMKEAGI